MYKKIRFVMVILLLISALIIGKTASRYVSNGNVEVRAEGDIIVLDPGHGGADPGKVGLNNSVEKSINLQIAIKVREKLEKEKVKVVMTRTEDRGLYAENSRNKKIEDMKSRVQIINEAQPKLAVSIHQNSYPEESVKGAQVFYFTHSEVSKEAAEIMQENLRMFDVENKRQAKANNTYYMLKKTESPTIIVECGFLSNWEEAKELMSEDYQEKISQVICDGILNILRKQK